MRNYTVYKYSKRELTVIFIESFLLSGVISLLFYDSLKAMVITAPVFAVLIKVKAMSLTEKQRCTLVEQFSETISFMAGSLHAGYSPENALSESYKEICLLHGGDCLMAKELFYMLNKMEVGVSMDELLTDFSYRCGTEEISSFVSVFLFARKSGGSFVKIINETSEKITEKVKILKEIEADISARKLECKVMNLVPILILAFMSITNPGYFDSLYHNAAGVLIMSVVLAVYSAAFAMSEKMVKEALKME